MTQQSVIQRNPILRWLLQTRRVPLLFAVTVVSGIVYHYAPKLTVLWIVLSLLLQGALFKLFDYVKKHNFVGGFFYVVTGTAFLGLALLMMMLGENAAPFAPQDAAYRIDFFVWFLTPQSVLTVDYPGFTIALFVLFTFFIASVTYYFTFVRYRVLMSFLVMLFPFAIYAKENEDMPVPSIIILLVCYFAVMIYCRQAHAEDSEVVQIYQPNAESRLAAPSRKSALSEVKPELLDGKFIYAAGIFLAAASILVLVIPKPTVEADRTMLDTLLDASKFSDYLMNAISAFADSSDGGKYNQMSYDRTLFYANAPEPMNLRGATYTDYHYDDDSWYASEYDKMPLQSSDDRYHISWYEGHSALRTVAYEPDPAALLLAIRDAAKQDPAFAAEYGLEDFAASTMDFSAFRRSMTISSATYGGFLIPAPLHTHDAVILNDNIIDRALYQNASGLVYRYMTGRVYAQQAEIRYVSDQLLQNTAVEALVRQTDSEVYPDMLRAIRDGGYDLTEDETWAVMTAITSVHEAKEYAKSVQLQTPPRVRALAEELTEGLTSDYDKAMAIRDYLKFGDYIYDLEYDVRQGDNVETFLFESKTGVCYQFACAMAELCRSVGLNVRYVEGYAMSEPDSRLIGSWDYAITTEHAHAFVDVYLPCYGWTMMDATTGSAVERAQGRRGNVIAALQYSGLILFAAALLLILVLAWLVPMLREKHFRRKYQQQRDAAAVQATFARLRKQWKADPAKTARVLCEEQSALLQTDLSELCSGVEETLYAGRCAPGTADRVFRVYCAAYDAWKPAQRRLMKERRAARRAARAAEKASRGRQPAAAE